MRRLIFIILLLFCVDAHAQSPIQMVQRGATAAQEAAGGGGLGTPAVLTTLQGDGGSSETTASVSPTGDALVLVFASNSAASAVTVTGVSSTFSAGTWTQVCELSDSDAGSFETTISVWRALAAATPGSGTVTVTLSANNGSNVIGVVEVTGASATLLQAETVEQSATTISIQLNASPGAGSVVIGTLAIANDAAVTESDTSIIEVQDIAASNPATLSVQYDETGDDTVSWSDVVNVAANAGTACAFEVTE